MDRVSLCDCIRYKKRKQKLHFKVLIFALFGPTSIPSMCGATHAAVAVHVSIDQWDTLQADCTVNKSLTKSLAEPASHSQSDSLSLNSQEQTPQQLHDKSIINPPQPKASNLSEEARTQVAAEKFMTTHTFQATDTTKRSPSLHFHPPPPSLLQLLVISKAVCRVERALGSNRRCLLVLLKNSVFVYGTK